MPVPFPPIRGEEGSPLAQTSRPQSCPSLPTPWGVRARPVALMTSTTGRGARQGGEGGVKGVPNPALWRPASLPGSAWDLLCDIGKRGDLSGHLWGQGGFQLPGIRGDVFPRTRPVHLQGNCQPQRRAH